MTILRSLVPVALLLALAASGRAQAADVPSRSDPYSVAPSFDGATARWQGFYAGAHAGGGFGKAGPANTSGMVGGVQAGYNWQADKVVVGVEADVSASGIRNNSFADKTRQKWLGTVRARPRGLDHRDQERTGQELDGADWLCRRWRRRDDDGCQRHRAGRVSALPDG